MEPGVEDDSLDAIAKDATDYIDQMLCRVKSWRAVFFLVRVGHHYCRRLHKEMFLDSISDNAWLVRCVNGVI